MVSVQFSLEELDYELLRLDLKLWDVFKLLAGAALHIHCRLGVTEDMS